MHISFATQLNSSPANSAPAYSLKPSENLWFSDVLRECKSGTLAEDVLYHYKTIRFHYLQYHATRQRLRKRYLPA